MSRWISVVGRAPFCAGSGFAYRRVLYMHSAPYAADAQGAINAVDPKLDIHWPLPITLRSERDESLPLLDDSFTGVACTRGGDR